MLPFKPIKVSLSHAATYVWTYLSFLPHPGSEKEGSMNKENPYTKSHHAHWLPVKIHKLWTPMKQDQTQCSSCSSFISQWGNCLLCPVLISSGLNTWPNRGIGSLHTFPFLWNRIWYLSWPQVKRAEWTESCSCQPVAKTMIIVFVCYV